MFLTDGQNETSVTEQGTSPAPAQTAENSNAAGAAGGAPIAAAASSSETPVSRGREVEVIADDNLDLIPPIKYGTVRSICIGVLESAAGHAILIKLVENCVGQWLFANPPTLGIAQMEKLTDDAGLVANDTVQAAMRQLTEVDLPRLIDNAKADILAHLTPMITAIVAGSAPPRADDPVAIAKEAQDKNSVPLEVGWPVKVWADAEHKAFREGEIVAIHDGAHAFDVKLDDGTVSKVGADGLEYDSRK